MQLTNASSTAAVMLHDELQGSEEQYQGGVKQVLVPAGGSVTINNTNACDSRAVQAALAAGTVTATQSALSVESNAGTGVDNYPLVPSTLIGNGVITWIGWTPSLAASATYVIAFAPGVVGADKVVRGFAFAATTEYGAVCLAVKTAGATATTDIGFTLAVDSCTITNNHATDAASAWVMIG